jgi:RNA polymerase subunit RPABC4/transcription elongation factor Spt4
MSRARVCPMCKHHFAGDAGSCPNCGHRQLYIGTLTITLIIAAVILISIMITCVAVFRD